MQKIDRVLQVVMVLLLAVIAGFIALQPRVIKPLNTSDVQAGAGRTNYVTGVVASAITTTAPTSTLIMASSSARQWVIIQNTGLEGEWLTFVNPRYNATTSKSDTDQGYFLSPSSSLTLDLDHLFTGAIWATSVTGTATTSITNFSPFDTLGITATST